MKKFILKIEVYKICIKKTYVNYLYKYSRLGKNCIHSPYNISDAICR